MAQDGEVNVKVKITAENGGVVQAESGMKRVGDSAKKTAAESKRGFEQMQASVGNVSKALGLFHRALAGFGVRGAITGVISVVDKIRDSFKSAKREAEEFDKAAKADEVRKSIEALAESYKGLTDSIARANAERQHENEIDDIKLKNARDIEDAQIDLAEQQELAAVDGNAADAEERRNVIRARYSERRGTIAAARNRENGTIERDRLMEDAKSKEAEAARIDEAIKRDDEAIRAARARRSAAAAESVSENDEDATGIWSKAGQNLKSIVTLNWGKFGDTRTAEGDKIRSEAAQRMKAEDDIIRQLENDRAGKARSANELREAARKSGEKAAALSGRVESDDLRMKIAQIRGSEENKGAQAALDKNHAAQAAKAARIADAEKARALLTAQKQSLQAQIADEQRRKDAAAYQVYQAQGTMNAARLGGKRDAQRSAFGNLKAAQDEAQNVNHAADSAINALTATLKSVEARLKAAQNYLESQSKRQRNAWSESPAGV